MSNNAEVTKVIQGLKAQGAIVEPRGKNMQRVRAASGGGFVDIHSTPSDNRWRDNLKPKVERAGFVWPLDDSRKLKMAVKEYRSPAFGVTIPDGGEDFTVPEGPLEHVVVPPGVRAMGGRRPMDRAIGLVRGAVFNLGPDKKTFWTAEVADQLNDFVGFRSNWKERGSGGIAVQRCQGILDWLGYRVVEARPNRNGYIYRWTLDPTKDRSAQETLPMIVPTPENSDVPVEEMQPQSTLVNPPKPLLPEEPKPVEVKEVADAETPTPEPVDTPAASAEIQEPEPTQPPVAVAEPPVVPVRDEPRAASEVAVVAGLPSASTVRAAASADVETALALLDDVGSWRVGLDALGKEGKRLEKMISRLGLQGELRVWRR